MIDWPYSRRFLFYISVPRENHALCTRNRCRGESILWRASIAQKILRSIKCLVHEDDQQQTKQFYLEESFIFTNLSWLTEISRFLMIFVGWGGWPVETGKSGTHKLCHRWSSFLLGSFYDKIPYKEHGLILCPFNARQNVPNWSKTQQDALDIAVSRSEPLYRVRGSEPEPGWSRLGWAGPHIRLGTGLTIFVM